MSLLILSEYASVWFCYDKDLVCQILKTLVFNNKKKKGIRNDVIHILELNY